MILSQLVEAANHRNRGYKAAPTVDHETQEEIDFINKMFLKSLPPDSHPFLVVPASYGVSTIFGLLKIPQVQKFREKYLVIPGYAFDVIDIASRGKVQYFIYYRDGEWYAQLTIGMRRPKTMKGTPTELLKAIKQYVAKAHISVEHGLKEIEEREVEKNLKSRKKK